MNENAHLKKFLQQSFDDHEIVESDNSWNKISGRVSFQNFFKFGTRHVNIYNTSIGAGLLCILYFSVFAEAFMPKLRPTNPIVATSNFEQQINIKNSSKHIEKQVIKNRTVNNSQRHPTYLSNNKSVEVVNDQSNVQNSSATEVIIENESLSLNEMHSFDAKLQEIMPTIIAHNIAKPEINKEKKPFAFNRLRWSVDVFTIPVYSDAMAMNTIVQSETEKQKVAAGFALKCLYGKILFETGFVYRSQSKDFSNTIYSEVVTDKVVAKTINENKINMFTGKSYEVVVDTFYVTEKVRQTQATDYEAQNTYMTMEIPISVGYRLSHNRFASTSKIGIVTYISQKATGKTIQNNNNKVVDLSGMPNTSASFMMTFSNSISYRVKGSLNVFAEPYVKFSTNSPKYNELSIGTTKTMYGLKLGIEVIL